MKKSSTKAALAALLLVFMWGCISDGIALFPGSRAGKPVKFATTTIVKTRAYDDVWETGDLIGVYMLPAGTDADDWNELGVDELFENVQYGHGLTTGEEGEEEADFTAVDDESSLKWPEDDSQVDFVAYYPWIDFQEINDFIYPVSILDQTPQKDIDLMWADARNKKSQDGNPELVFKHKLAKIVFNVIDDDGASLAGLTSTFEGLPTMGGFDLRKGR